MSALFLSKSILLLCLFRDEDVLSRFGIDVQKFESFPQIDCYFLYFILLFFFSETIAGVWIVLVESVAVEVVETLVGAWLVVAQLALHSLRLQYCAFFH